jgi:hypothetical protein
MMDFVITSPSLLPSQLYFAFLLLITMSAKYHALAAAAAMTRRDAPKGARAWSRALPSLEVSQSKRFQFAKVVFVTCR